MQCSCFSIEKENILYDTNSIQLQIDKSLFHLSIKNKTEFFQKIFFNDLVELITFTNYPMNFKLIYVSTNNFVHKYLPILRGHTDTKNIFLKMDDLYALPNVLKKVFKYFLSDIFSPFQSFV